MAVLRKTLQFSCGLHYGIFSSMVGESIIKGNVPEALGKAEGPPTDLAENHDHYLHGQAKR